MPLLNAQLWGGFWDCGVRDGAARQQCPSRRMDTGDATDELGRNPVQVYLPMSYVYGVRGTCAETELTKAIR